jgi:hypothetical protein
MFRKHRIPAANKKPFDRKAFLGKALLFASCLALASGIYGFCFLVFGNELGRWGSSLSFLWESLEASFGSSGKAAAPNAPNIGTADYGSLSSAFQNFAFLYQTACGLLLNQHWLQEWGVGQERILLRIMQALMYVPIPFILYLCAKKIVSGMKPQGKQKEMTGPLRLYEKIYGLAGPKARAAKAALRAYVAPESRGRYWKLAWAAAALAASPVGPALLDFATGYLFFLFTLSTDEIKPLFLSNMTDLWVTLRQLGWLNLIWIGIIVFLILRKSALDTLRQMQASNYDRATRPGVGVLATGQPGSGHSAMSTSEALDWEYSFRDQLLGDIHRARNGFPDFPWANLEGWIQAKAESKKIVTRAQFEEWIKCFYAVWKSHGFMAKNEGRTLFFGYDGRKMPTAYFDGAKMWEVIDAVTDYACAYFLTYKGIVMITANYSIQDRMQAKKSSFTLYGKHDDYLKKGCRPPLPKLDFCAATEWDSFRLGKKVMDVTGLITHFDGGAVVMDEISLERGNRIEHYAKGDESGKTSPENDRMNDWMKLIRHFYSNSGKPVAKVFANTQREGAVNGDFVALFEERDWISANDGEDNALPLWAIDDFLCSHIVGFVDSWLDLCRNRELRQTLFNKAAQVLSKPVADHWYRMRLSYGFQRLHVSSWTGQPEGGGAGESDLFEYYLMPRKMWAYTYKTDTFHALVRMRSMGSIEGYQQARHYESLDPKDREYNAAGSYIVEGIMENMASASGAADKAHDAIAAGSEKGTDA